MPRFASSVQTQYVAALLIALAIALLAGCDGSGGIVAGDQDTPIDFGETDTTKQLDIQNTSDHDIAFELLVNYGDGPKDWLTYSPITAECGPAQSVVFTLEADRNVLPAGLWEAEVVVTSGAIRKSVIVSIAVVAAATNINTHNFWTSSEPLEFAVWNAGGGELQFEVAKVPAWLAVANGTGTSTGPTDRKTVTLSPNRSGLEPGTYSDQVVIIPVNGLSTFRKTIDVTMTVLPPGVPALTIQATPTSGDAPLDVQFKAMNGSVLADSPTAGYTINWDFGDDTTVGQGNQVSHRFASSGTFLVTLSLVGALGTFDCHQATITVNSDPAQPGALVVTPTDDAIFSGPPGGPYTSVNGVTSYNLKNVGGKSISWTAGAGAPSWVSVAKGSGTVAPGMTDTASITVNSNANNLPAGTYSGGVVFATPDGTVITTRKVSLKITPIANDDSYSINEDKTLNVMAVAGVLANDPGHGQLPAKLVSGPSYGPSHGSVTLNPNGSFSYTPAANFNGSDSFSYKLSDAVLSSNIAMVSITVKPVNDPPTIDVPIPPPPITGVNGTIEVPMTVSPGPADEASQKVTVTVISSNQAVVRDADLRFDGSQLTITAVGTGSTTITVKATDDGGTTDDRGIANGGVDTATRTFGVTAFDGVPISGMISLVETVGARPKFGQHGLKFTGTGASAGQNFTTLTDVDGHYTQPVPEGWTGTITAQDPIRMIFLDPVTKAGYDQNGQDVSVRKITTPVARPGLAGQDIVAWTAPIGIPGPEFGIRETPPIYDASNPLHYYVDNTVPGATDSGNACGSPAKPRVTMPRNLPAGAYVEIHGGPYSYGSGYIQITGQGTASSPVFIVGVGMPRFIHKLSVYHPTDENRYIILQGLDLFKWECVAPAKHIVLRNCDIHGDVGSGGVAVASYNSLYSCSDILLHNNVIHDNGDWQAEFDQDVHAIAVKARVRNLWAVDNEMYHNSGDGIQINAGNLDAMPTTHHIYVGRNLSHENKQSGLWTKQAMDVIFSQNTVHTIKPIGSHPSASGPGIGFQYGPERVWFLYNHIYDTCYGIMTASTSGMGSGQNCYVIGNVIHDIHHDSGYAYNPATGWSNAGIMMVGSVTKYLINNTIYNVDAGINSPSNGKMIMTNNVISNVTEPLGQHVFIENSQTALDSDLSYSLFYQNGDPVRIRWGSTAVYTLPTLQTATGKGANCANADPEFVDVTAGDFRVQSYSPAVDEGLADGVVKQVCDEFQHRYGVGLRVDYDGTPRPAGASMDMGAYER